jgi:hypothetical protein
MAEIVRIKSLTGLYIRSCVRLSAVFMNKTGCMIETKESLVLLFIVVFGMLTAMVFGVQANKSEALLGTWDVETENGSYRFEFKFELQDGDLVGFYIGNSGEAIMEDLSFEDNKLYFYVIVDATGRGMILDFEATVSGSNLEGMISLEYGDSYIVGKKRE